EKRRERHLPGADRRPGEARLAEEPALEAAVDHDVLQVDVHEPVPERRERGDRIVAGGYDAPRRPELRGPVRGAREVGVPVVLDREPDAGLRAERVDDGKRAAVDDPRDEVDAERGGVPEGGAAAGLDVPDGGADEAADRVRLDRDPDLLRRAADARRGVGVTPVGVADPELDRAEPGLADAREHVDALPRAEAVRLATDLDHRSGTSRTSGASAAASRDAANACPRAFQCSSTR